ncbi:9770_t:CDS:2 [Dentiscutata heterogama]|uniref:9770_t:CDS:1 n=1 Tax=Dentiscutata heterogama TaxID=1316150 RepID=A0ACA9JVB7_9GLOM|nr:9770_t:CDS:2 [Dentiscutata heterogama]
MNYAEKFTIIKILKAIRNEVFIMSFVSIVDLPATVVPPLLMTSGNLTFDCAINLLFLVLRDYTSTLISSRYILLRINQFDGVEEDKLNKPFRPVPSGLVTVEGARHRLIAFNIIFPTVSYLIGGLPLFISAFLWQTWFVTFKLFDLSANALCKNFFSAFGAWIMFVVASNLIIGTEFNVSNWWGREPCPSKLSVVIFVLLTLQIQDLRDQKGDEFIGRKTLPLLIGDNICRWLTALALVLSAFILYGSVNYYLILPGVKNLNKSVPLEFTIIEIVLFAVAAWVCVRLIKYRDQKEDRYTYEIWYSGFYAILCLYYGMAIGTFAKIYY